MLVLVVFQTQIHAPSCLSSNTESTSLLASAVYPDSPYTLTQCSMLELNLVLCRF
ncbi:hypothetical protein RchiOBHm_Chr5g0026261 [Rosa chinensis]|uniref:Uncharacterized protein n=1 Tax=Rosa chinensis TaxID=74649 RepID=A0A2P6Q8T1_ROSCH|nr:hypothetical protein RchiOBHm_Chr5g0026261 [Rosa chinensis]